MLQDFRAKNLRGQSFRGQNLTCSDFSGADLRGVDFTNAVLTQANLSQVQTGLSYGWLISLSIGLVLVSLLGGSISAYAAAFAGSPPSDFTLLTAYLVSRIAAGVLLAVFLVITLRQGLGSTLAAFAVSVAAIVAVMLALPGVSPLRGEVVLQAVAIAVAVAGVLVSAIALVTAKVILARGGTWLTAILVVLGTIPGALAGFEGTALNSWWVMAMITTVPVIVILVGLSFYLAWRSLAGEQKYSLIHTMAIALGSWGGTRFRGANLTDATFIAAHLKNADFRGAILTRTNWFQAKYLGQARTVGTYLSNPRIRQLVVSQQGQEQSYDHLDLRGLNLQEANLTDASFIGTKLSESTLQFANLSRAKLVQTQLYGANLTGAILTGAIIQDWSISIDTLFAHVQCDYVYMQLPTKADPDPCRKPDNRSEIFQDGDFADFIAPIVKTLDLYRTQHLDPRKIAHHFKTLDLLHHDGIDPAAAAIALKQLAEQYPEAELQVVALEGRGEDKVRLQAKVADATDRSTLSREYFAKYEEISALPYADLQSLLAGIAEKDERIRSLESMVMTAIESNKFYVETYYSLGDTVSEKSSININSGGGNISGVVGGDIKDVSGVVNLGVIQGDVSNAIGQLPSAATPEQPGLKELLTQLQTAIEATTELSPEDKAEALEQVKTLAEAGVNPEDGTLKKAAKTAMKILKGTIASLPDVTTLVTESAKLLPAITTLLALI